jgi:hypothetical protein
VTPRIGAALDLFGNGRTALKASLNKYLIGVDSAAFRYGQLAPTTGSPLDDAELDR